MKFLPNLLLILPLAAAEKVPSEAKQAFQTNCLACHNLDTQIVGPSLVTLTATYPAEIRADFLAWTKDPGKKDPNLIQMPSMAHLPDDTLVDIHKYILSVTEGVKEKKASARFPSFKEPDRPLPYVVRASMPDSSPASVAIILPNNLSVCWDAEACRFRYAYTGSKTDLGNTFVRPELPSKPFYRETAKKLFPFPQKPRFLGYRLIDKNPEFRYLFGALEIHELIAAGPMPDSITRSFTLSKELPLTLDLSSQGKAILTSDKGTLKDGKLTLTAGEAKQFTLTISKS